MDPETSLSWARRRVQHDGLWGRQTEKLVPQPQPEAALGLVTWKAAPPRLSTKSTVDPRTRSSEMGSTTRVPPSSRATASSAATASASSNLYWKPAQPPPSTD